MKIKKFNGFYKPEFISRYEVIEEINSGLYANINFQDGPIKEVGKNGCQITDILDVCIHQLEQFQIDKLACKENEATLSHLKQAKEIQMQRTRDREGRGVEGTDQE